MYTSHQHHHFDLNSFDRSGTTARLVSVEDSGNTLIGTFTLAGGRTEFVEKNASDEIFAAHAEVLGVGVAITT